MKYGTLTMLTTPMYPATPWRTTLRDERRDNAVADVQVPSRRGRIMKPYDLAIVGLGAMGSMAAWQATRRGLRVIGFDRFRPPHSHGSSTGHSRIIREAYFEQRYYVPLVQEAYRLWEELERESGSTIYLRTGGLMLGPRDGTVAAGAIASMEAFGLEAEVLTGAEVRHRFPAFEAGDDIVGLYEPRAGSLTPEAGIEAALRLAEQGGAVLLYDTPVEGWESGSNVEVRTAAGRYRADRVILSAGAWMAGDLTGIELPLTVSRQLLFWLEPSGGREPFQPSRFPVFLWEWEPGRSFYGFPDQGRGVKVAIHHEGAATDPDTIDRTVGPHEVDELLEILGSTIPSARGPVLESAVCMYTNTPNEDFIVDRHPADDRILVASPCSGHGFKFAPTIGGILVDLVVEGGTRFDLGPFRIGGS